MYEQFSEIHKLLKLGPENEAVVHGGPIGLPVAHKESQEHGHEQIEHIHNPAPHFIHVGPVRNDAKKLSFVGLLIYPVIFFTAFAFFFIVLNFSAVMSQIQGWFAAPQEEQILGKDLEAYYKWMNNYFYVVTDRALLEPNNDIDGDGLTNYDEFILRTNPILADSDEDGYPDGIEVINGYNFWGRGVMTKQQRDLAAKLDVIMINNRISYGAAQNTHGIVASATVSDNYDLQRHGRISIPKLNLQVPLVWSQHPADFDNDLTKGVIHYPGTAYPGDNGIIYVSGHSSDYIWKRNPMQNVFSRLNHLSAGDDIFIEVYGKDGKVYNYRYKVEKNQVYAPDDQRQFYDNSNTSRLNLSTCWPIGTTKDRLVVTAVPVEL